MQRREILDFEEDFSSTLPNGLERVLFRMGKRPHSTNTDLREDFAVAYEYGPDANVTESETIEVRHKDAGINTPPRSLKYAVRWNPNQPCQIPLHLPNGHDLSVGGRLVTIGYTREGGAMPDPREPWARVVIDNSDELKKAFTGYDLSGRQPNRSENPTHNFLVIEAPPSGSLISPIWAKVNGQAVTLTHCQQITLDIALDDAPKNPGAILKAYLRKMNWVEGDTQHTHA